MSSPRGEKYRPRGRTIRILKRGCQTKTENGTARLILNAERVTPGGLVYGIRAELDTGNRVAEELQRDETYIYVAGEFGRLELGEQDGPADTVSYHAPVVGLGQIRGDFVRYTGTLALLSPFDTSDAPKVVYLSSPQRGLRFGLSYAPEYSSNEDNPNPRARTIQQNAFEAAVAYQTTIGDWAGGVSMAYVGAEADPITERADIDSWSVGLQFSRNELSIGGAFVSRGDSNSLTPGLDEEEVNLGLAWRADTWGLGLSASRSSSLALENRLIGLGGYYELGQFWVLRATWFQSTSRVWAVRREAAMS
ncbi:MAG: porin [Rhodospirillales bacterium]|nr:porin [Rhodospirillales bacterium]